LRAVHSTGYRHNVEIHVPSSSSYNPATEPGPLLVKFVCIVGFAGAAESLLNGLSQIAGLPVGIISGSMIVGMALGQMVSLYGLWTLKEWGWTSAVVTYAMGALTGVIGVLTGPGGWFSVLVDLGVLGYLVLVRDYYK
jgi:uncharacterized membrane protein (DUF2068 family)